MNRIQIEVVRGLVEQQRLRMSEQSLGQQHAHLLSTRQLRHFPLVLLVGNVETLQQNRCVRFGGITIFLAYDAFQFPEFHAVRICHLMLCIDDFAFF